MTAALAIGYDWLHAELTPEGRGEIARAIREKGLEASLPEKGGDDDWSRRDNNWNPVCNGGMLLGALALQEDDPALAARIARRAVESVPRAMEVLAPDGAYPEGPNYWDYGIAYNVLLIAALDSALGSDYELSRIEGWVGTPYYQQQMRAPSGYFFNYADASPRRGYSIPMFWFASQLGDRSLLWQERDILARAIDNALASKPPRRQDRLFPMLLLWSPPLSEPPPVPETLHWLGRGPIPVAVHRSSWTEPPRAYLGIKAGTPSGNHGHMDIGSFVYEADGARWGVDLGMQQYHSLESRGVKIWDRAQEGDRWRVFRLSSLSHSTLVVDGHLQRVKEDAPIVKFAGREDAALTVVDMSPVYEGQLTEARRGFRMLKGGRVLIQDDLRPLRAGQRIRWAMMTAARLEQAEGGRAVLSLDGQSLRLEILAPAEARWRTWPADPPRDYDAPNPGMQLVGFETVTTSAEALRLAAVLTPGSTAAAPGDPPALTPLADWPGDSVK